MFQNMVRRAGWENYVFDQDGQNAIIGAVRSHSQDDLDAIEADILLEAQALAQRREYYIDARSHHQKQRYALNMPQKNATHIVRPFLRDKPTSRELVNPRL